MTFTPRDPYLDLRAKGIVSELKPNLVIALKRKRERAGEQGITHIQAPGRRHLHFLVKTERQEVCVGVQGS